MEANAEKETMEKTEKKARIKPFVIGKEERKEEQDRKIRPIYFEQEKDEEKDLGKTVAEQKLQTESPVKVEAGRELNESPIRIIDEGSASKARALFEQLDVSEQAKEVLVRYCAQGIMENPELKASIPAVVATVPCFNVKKGMNFSLTLKGIKERFYDTEEGEMGSRSYVILVKVVKKSGKMQFFEAEVEANKIKGVEWLKKATDCLAHIPLEKNEKKTYAEMVQNCIETENVVMEMQYPNAGWRDIPLIGWRYVFAGGAIGQKNILIHTDLSYSLDVKEDAMGTKETFFKALGMASVCVNKSASHTLLLYVHASMLATVFELSGYPLNFVYVLQGVTNSRKTSLVTAIAKLFNRKKMIADAEFATATSCGIEKTVSRYKDAPVLIDDFKPGATMAQQREMERKLDELIRLYGNRVAKKRMTDFMPRGKEKFFPVGGGCVLTAEVLTGVSSTLTRAFVVEINNTDVNNELLGFYQAQYWILPTYAYDFLLWVTENFSKVVNFIGNHFPEYRKKANFQYARYAEIYATFSCVGFLISVYASDRGFWRETEAKQFMDITQQYAETILLNNQEKLSEKNKGKFAIQVFGEALETAKIVSTELNEQTCQQRKDLYEDESRYYVRSQILRRLIEQYSHDQHMEKRIFSEEELLMLLENLGVLEIEETAGKRVRSRKLPIQRGNTLRYLYLKKIKVINILAE